MKDDDLVARGGGVAWEAGVCWKTVEEGQTQGCELVRDIRFPLRKEGYLRARVVGMAPQAAEDADLSRSGFRA